MTQTSIIQIDDADFKEYLKNAPKQIIRASLDGVNRTQEEALIAGKRHVLSAFTNRTPMFLNSIPTGQPGSPIPRGWRATPESPFAVVAIGDGGSKKQGDRRRAILEPFEAGKPKVGKRAPVAIPTKALRPSKTGLVPAAMYPRNLLGMFNSKGEFQESFKRGKNKGTKLGRGARSIYSYFVVMNARGNKANGIYERTGPGKVRMIWAFRERVSRPSSLRWLATTGGVARERMHLNVAAQITSRLKKMTERGEVVG